MAEKLAGAQAYCATKEDAVSLKEAAEVIASAVRNAKGRVLELNPGHLCITMPGEDPFSVQLTERDYRECAREAFRRNGIPIPDSLKEQ